MKKLLLLFVAVLALSSCDNDDDLSNFYYDVTPAESADVPEQMELGQVYEITIDYIRPTDCYYFYTIDYERSTDAILDDNGDPITRQVRKVSVINMVDTDSTCEDVDENTQVSFDFEARIEGPYLFKFYAGQDEDDNAVYLEYESEVVRNIE